MNPLRKILITTGDSDGIGLEVTYKALAKLGPQRGIQFVIFKAKSGFPKTSALLNKKFKVLKFDTWCDVCDESFSNSKNIVEINSSASAAHWVEMAASACLEGRAAAMVTAPLSKQLIITSGLKDLGHTDILKRLSQKKEAFMGFCGDKFNVVLATAHVPVSEISNSLTLQKLEAAIRAANEMRQLLSPKQAKLPMAMVGLNPHASDDGLIGQDDLRFKQLLISLQQKGIPIQGTLVPDVAYFKSNWSKYSVYVAPYHDQGLIPFKLIHGFDAGVHITLGLPIIRTSVDHGTAKDIFGKNKANPNSMLEALKFAVSLANKK